MKKADRAILAEMFSNHESNYCMVVTIGKTYAIIKESDGTILATGKELKGYVDDIIYPQYDGMKHGTGNYYLKGDLHGIICKWKNTDDVATLTEISEDKLMLTYPDGRVFVGSYAECLNDYYGDPYENK